MAVTVYTPPKTWAYKEALSSADMNLYVRDNIIALKEQIGGIGSFMFLGFEGTPDGPVLACDGAAVSRSTYAALFAKLGTAWGVGDGSTTFNLPNSLGRSPMGAGSGAGLTARTVGQMFGEETHVLIGTEMPPHSHGVNDPGHFHTVAHKADDQDGSGSNGSTSGSSNTSTNTTGITIQSEGGGGGHNVIQPVFVCKVFIRYA